MELYWQESEAKYQRMFREFEVEMKDILGLMILKYLVNYYHLTLDQKSSEFELFEKVKNLKVYLNFIEGTKDSALEEIRLNTEKIVQQIHFQRRKSEEVVPSQLFEI